MLKVSIEQSNLIWRLKGIAIFTVFFAHMPYSGSNESVNYAFNLLGMIGVPTFLILSGFFDYGSSFNMLKVVKSLFIPSIILGTVGYAMSHYNIKLDLGGGGIVVDWLKWIYGCGSWLYFVPVLFWCKFISRPSNYIYQVLLVTASITSIVLTSYGKIPYNGYFTPYTNPFNFLIYFQVGKCIRKYEIDISRNFLLFVAVITAVITIVFWKDLPSYFSVFAIPMSLSTYIILYRIAAIIRHGEEIGKLSYVIYLIHLIPAGILNRYGLQYLGSWFDFIKVPVVFAIICFVVWFGKVCLEKLKLDKLSQYIGYR